MNNPSGDRGSHYHMAYYPTALATCFELLGRSRLDTSSFSHSVPGNITVRLVRLHKCLDWFNRYYAVYGHTVYGRSLHRSFMSDRVVEEDVD